MPSPLSPRCRRSRRSLHCFLLLLVLLEVDLAAQPPALKVVALLPEGEAQRLRRARARRAQRATQQQAASTRLGAWVRRRTAADGSRSHLSVWVCCRTAAASVYNAWCMWVWVVEPLAQQQAPVQPQEVFVCASASLVHC